MIVVWRKSTVLQYCVHIIIRNVQYIHKNIILTRVPCLSLKIVKI